MLFVYIFYKNAFNMIKCILYIMLETIALFLFLFYVVSVIFAVKIVYDKLKMG